MHHFLEPAFSKTRRSVQVLISHITYVMARRVRPATLVRALLASAAAAGAAGSCDYALYPDVNFDGTDLPNQPVSSTLSTPDQCAALCCAAAKAPDGGVPGGRALASGLFAQHARA